MFSISPLSLTTIALIGVITSFQFANLSFNCCYLLINIVLLPSRPLVKFIIQVLTVGTAHHPLQYHQIVVKICTKGLYVVFQFRNALQIAHTIFVAIINRFCFQIANFVLNVIVLTHVISIIIQVAVKVYVIRVMFL